MLWMEVRPWAATMGKTTRHDREIAFEVGRVGIGIGLAAGGEAKPVAIAALQQRPDRIEGFALAQLARGQPVWPHDDLVARPKLALPLRMPACLQRHRIGPGGVVIGREDEERPVLHDAIEMMAGQRLGLGDDDVVRLLADHEIASGIVFQVGQRAGLQLVESLRARQLQMLEFGRAGKEMHVGFDKAGRDGGTPGIDHPRRGPLLRCNLAIAAHRGDTVAGDRQRLGLGTGVVHGEDGGIFDDDVCTHVRGPFQLMPSAAIMARQAGRWVTRSTSRLICG